MVMNFQVRIACSLVSFNGVIWDILTTNFLINVVCFCFSHEM